MVIAERQAVSAAATAGIGADASSTGSRGTPLTGNEDRTERASARQSVFDFLGAGGAALTVHASGAEPPMPTAVVGVANAGSAARVDTTARDPATTNQHFQALARWRGRVTWIGAEETVKSCWGETPVAGASRW